MYTGEPRLLNGVWMTVDWIEDETSREIILPGHQLPEGSLGPPRLKAWLELWL